MWEKWKRMNPFSRAIVMIVSIILLGMIPMLFFEDAPAQETKDCIPQSTVETNIFTRTELMFLLVARVHGVSEPTEETMVWAWNQAEKYLKVLENVTCKGRG